MMDIYIMKQYKNALKLRIMLMISLFQPKFLIFIKLCFQMKLQKNSIII